MKSKVQLLHERIPSSNEEALSLRELMTHEDLKKGYLRLYTEI